MKQIFVILLACLALQPMFGQMAGSDEALVKTYAGTITGEDFNAHLSFLADDLLEGRETGKRGQKLAAKYIRTQFMRLGLQPGVPENNSYFQEYILRYTTVNSAQISIGEQPFSYKEDFFTFRSPLPEQLDAPLAFAGHGRQAEDYNNFEGMDPSGKMLMVLSGGPGAESGGLREQIGYWINQSEAWEASGAAGVMLMIPDSIFSVLSRYAGNQSMQVVGTGSTSFPLVFISEKMGKAFFDAAGADLEKTTQKLAKSAKVKGVDFSGLSLGYEADIDREDVVAENVLGFMEGTDQKDEILVLTAHFDHIGIVREQINNGADDDGSGTTAILELAEAFSRAAGEGHRPRRSILFMTVSGEEKGLLGSDFYTQNPIYPLDNTIANLNIDMIGRIDKKYETREDSTNYVYLIGSDKLSSELHQISESANDTYTGLTLDYTFNDENDPNRFYYRSDHYNFAKNNIPVIFYFTGVHDDYHRPGDDVEKIRFDKTAKITQLVFATAWELANRDARIAVDSNKK